MTASHLSSPISCSAMPFAPSLSGRMLGQGLSACTPPFHLCPSDSPGWRVDTEVDKGGWRRGIVIVLASSQAASHRATPRSLSRSPRRQRASQSLGAGLLHALPP